MTTIALYQSKFFLKSISNYPNILSTQINYIYFFTRLVKKFLLLKPIYLLKLCNNMTFEAKTTKTEIT